MLGLGRAQLVGVAAQLDDDRRACDQCGCSAAHDSAESRSVGVVEDDTRRVGPAVGRGRGRGDDDAPAEAAGNIGIGQRGHRGVVRAGETAAHVEGARVTLCDVRGADGLDWIPAEGTPTARRAC